MISTPTVLGNRTEYRIDGQLHREDGPAIIWNDGCKEWWFNGALHRIDGAAVIYSNGYQSWYINGENITVKVIEWCKENEISMVSENWNKATKVLFVMRFR